MGLSRNGRPTSKYVESDRRSFFIRRKTRVIYYLLVLILGIELYTVKVSIKS